MRRQMSSRYIPAGKRLSEAKKAIGAHDVKDRFKTYQNH
jgi:hypothetical protein